MSEVLDACEVTTSIAMVVRAPIFLVSVNLTFLHAQFSIYCLKFCYQSSYERQFITVFFKTNKKRDIARYFCQVLNFRYRPLYSCRSGYPKFRPL